MISHISLLFRSTEWAKSSASEKPESENGGEAVEGGGKPPQIE